MKAELIQKKLQWDTVLNTDHEYENIIYKHAIISNLDLKLLSKHGFACIKIEEGFEFYREVNIIQAPKKQTKLFDK